MLNIAAVNQYSTLHFSKLSTMSFDQQNDLKYAAVFWETQFIKGENFQQNNSIYNYIIYFKLIT